MSVNKLFRFFRSKKDLIIKVLVIGVLFLVIAVEAKVVIREFDIPTIEESFNYNRPVRRYVVIEPWMTFDYINKVFALPNNYLRSSLNIGDEKYPDLEIRRYARRQNLDSTELIKKIIVAIHSYRLE